MVEPFVFQAHYESVHLYGFQMNACQWSNLFGIQATWKAKNKRKLGQHERDLVGLEDISEARRDDEFVVLSQSQIDNNFSKCCNPALKALANSNTDFGNKYFGRYNKLPLIVEMFKVVPPRGNSWFSQLTPKVFVRGVKLMNLSHHPNHKGWMFPRSPGKKGNTVLLGRPEEARGFDDPKAPSGIERVSALILNYFIDRHKDGGWMN